MEDYVKKRREEVIALADEMVKSVRFALGHELDGRLAHAMLKDIGRDSAAGASAVELRA